MNRNVLTQEIIRNANLLSKELDRYNTRVLIVFLREELDRNYDEIILLKKEKHKILMMLSKLKKDVIKESLVLDIDEMNKVF